MTLADPGEIDFASESEASPHTAKISRSFKSEREKEMETNSKFSELKTEKTPFSAAPQQC